MANKNKINVLVDRLGKNINFRRTKDKEELIKLLSEYGKIREIKKLKGNLNFVSSILDSKKILNPILAEFDTIVEEDYQKFANSVSLKEEVEAFVKLQALQKELARLILLKDIANKSTVAVGGGFSAGKSQFISSFFADDKIKLPIGVKPVTAIASYIINGEKVSEENTEAKIVSMPIPVFDVVASAQTSYSVYNLQGAAAANETDGSGIFNITATTSISHEILSNEKYANLLSLTYSLDTGESTTEESPVFENLKWGKRTLTVMALFDGGNDISSLKCDVTGVPYKGDYTNKSPFDDAVNPWICVGNGEFWDDHGFILFQYSGAFSTNIKYNNYVFSPAFKNPENVDIRYSIKVAYFTGGIGNPSIDIYTGVSNNTDNCAKDKTTTIKRINSNQNPKDDKFTIISDDSTIGNNYMICLSHNSAAERNWVDNWLTFKSLEVLYR